MRKSQDLGEKLTNTISQLEGDMRKSQDLGEKLTNTVSLLGGEIITLKSEVKDVVNGHKTIRTSLDDKN